MNIIYPKREGCVCHPDDMMHDCSNWPDEKYEEVLREYVRDVQIYLPDLYCSREHIKQKILAEVAA